MWHRNHPEYRLQTRTGGLEGWRVGDQDCQNTQGSSLTAANLPSPRLLLMGAWEVGASCLHCLSLTVTKSTTQVFRCEFCLRVLRLEGFSVNRQRKRFDLYCLLSDVFQSFSSLGNYMCCLEGLCSVNCI